MIARSAESTTRAFESAKEYRRMSVNIVEFRRISLNRVGATMRRHFERHSGLFLCKNAIAVIVIRFFYFVDAGCNGTSANN